MKTFEVYNRLNKLGTPKVLQTDRWSGPTTRPAFAKATQVKKNMIQAPVGSSTRCDTINLGWFIVYTRVVPVNRGLLL